MHSKPHCTKRNGGVLACHDTARGIRQLYVPNASLKQRRHHFHESNDSVLLSSSTAVKRAKLFQFSLQFPLGVAVLEYAQFFVHLVRIKCRQRTVISETTEARDSSEVHKSARHTRDAIKYRERMLLKAGKRLQHSSSCTRVRDGLSMPTRIPTESPKLVRQSV